MEGRGNGCYQVREVTVRKIEVHLSPSLMSSMWRRQGDLIIGHSLGDMLINSACLQLWECKPASRMTYMCKRSRRNVLCIPHSQVAVPGHTSWKRLQYSEWISRDPSCAYRYAVVYLLSIRLASRPLRMS